MCYSILAGNIVRFFMTFLDGLDALADPTEVACLVGTSILDAVALTVVRDDVGRYHADWDTTLVPAGDYYCEGVGSGAIVAATEITVKIRSPHLA